MFTPLTDTELKKELKEHLTIICDTREQVNGHILDWFRKQKIQFVERGLSTGDYSVMWRDKSFEDEVLVERKANLDEIAGNFTTGRERFEREFTRAKANGTKVFLIVENASWSDIMLGNYRSKLNPKSFLSSFLSWQAEFNITILFCKPSETPRIIHGILYYWVRNRLKRG